MLKELYEAISRQAVEANEKQILQPPGGPEHVYGIVHRDGTVEWKEAAPHPRNHKAGDLDSLVANAERFAPQADGADTVAVCWYSRKGVVLLAEDATRRDRVTLPLTLSPQLAYLQRLEESKPRVQFTQADLVLTLRTTLARSISPDVVAVFRRLNFRKSSGGASEVGHGKASIGRELQAELTGSGAIPETLAFRVPVFAAGVPFEAAVECAVDVQAEAERFLLIPLPGEIENAITQAETYIGGILAENLPETVPAFYGEP